MNHRTKITMYKTQITKIQRKVHSCLFVKAPAASRRGIECARRLAQSRGEPRGIQPLLRLRSDAMKTQKFSRRSSLDAVKELFPSIDFSSIEALLEEVQKML